MLTCQTISSFDDPRLAPYRNLRAQFDHLAGGCFVAEGDKILHRLLESPHEVISAVLPPQRASEFEPLLAARREAVDLFLAERSVLQQLTGFRQYQGVLALGRVPRAAAFDDLLALPPPRLFAALDALSGAENVGAVARNAVALGVQALLVGETSAHPYLRRAVRSSMGTIFKLPYLIAADLAATLRQLRAAGVRVVAAHPHMVGRTLWQTDLTGGVCLVLGAEGDGIRPEVLAACNEQAAIPMHNAIDSLNVAGAAAIFFAEAQRQRLASATVPGD